MVKWELHDAQQGEVVMTFQGGLSWEERESLAPALDQHLAGRGPLRGLVVDLAAVEFINSAGLGGLFQLEQRVRSHGGRLAFANIPPTIRRLLTTVGMQRLAILADDLTDALRQLAGTPGEAGEQGPRGSA